MKKYLFTAIALLFVPLFLYAQTDKIQGIWFTEEGTSTVEVTKSSNGTYVGKINWLEEPNENGKPKVDEENSDPELAKRPIMGLSIVKDFQYNSKKERWDEGSIYDPDNGKTYKCKIKLNKDGTLKIRGFIGVSIIGRTTKWTRVENTDE